MKIFVRVLKIALIVILSLVLIFFVYYAYMAITYYRIEDKLEIEVQNNQSSAISTNKDYTISTYNIGFGAYEPTYSFFMDSGEMLDGTKVSGKYSRGFNKESVLKNTTGSIELMKNLNSDFMLFQEVDTNSTRSFKINQQQMIINQFNNYSSTFAVNFHSSYLMYPFNSPHGIANSGLLSLSKYKMENSTRVSLPISEGFINKFLDLDRCLDLVRYKVNNKELLIINAHLSAYDEGGVFRKKQIELINSILKEEKEKGNYVILGGDFNQDIAASKTVFKTTQKIPAWIYDLTDSDLAAGYNIVKSINAPTCRAAEIPYQKGVNHTVVIDGFIISDNIEVSTIENLDYEFLYSDHNPVKMTFKLKN